nr:myb/SANT-like DNA-binding domain-containing protein 1 [Dermacentor andersoni]
MAAGRAHWSQAETFTLIRTWEDNLSDLRRAKRNQKVYAHIVEELFKAGVENSLKETKTKIENLGNKYRDINKKKGTACGQITWPFYWDIHKFLQALPINDDSLLHDSVCNSSSTVEQLITSMEYGNDFGSDEDASVGDAALVDAEALSSTQGSASEDPSPLVSDSEGSQAPTPPAARKRADRQALKKRQPSQQLLLTRVVEEQRQLRLSLEKSKEKELSMRERQLRLDEAAAEREERLIAALEKIVGK